MADTPRTPTVGSAALTPIAPARVIGSVARPGTTGVRVANTSAADTQRTPLVGSLALAGIASTIGGAAWVPPIGIPAPSFGITQTAPAFPSPWTAAVTDCYYVEPTHPNATNTSNPNGWPAQPRLTVPLTITPVAGPVVVQVVGQYNTEHEFTQSVFTMNGTAARPIFIRGTSDAVRPSCSRAWQFWTANYTIVEYIDFLGSCKALIGPYINYFAWRHCDLEGDNNIWGGFGIGGFGTTDEVYTVNQLVIWDNHVKSAGNWQTSADQDIHGVAVGWHIDGLWIVDNELEHCSGDGVQVGAGTNGVLAPGVCPKNIYAGRNHSHHNKQTGLWCKQATDVIFSQNDVHDLRRDSISSGGQGMGCQYSPERIWFIFNDIHDCQGGIMVHSAGDIWGTYVYVVGNLFRNIHNTGPTAETPENPHTSAGIAIGNRGTRECRIVGNTILGSDGGIYAAVSGPIHVVNNVVGDRNLAFLGYDMFIEFPNATSLVKNNDLEDLRVKWGGAVYTTVASLQAAVGAMAAGNLKVDPQLVSTTDLHPVPGSPLLGAGLADEAVYSDFEALYPGRSIRVDYDGQARPVGAWDIGAYED